MVEWGKIEKPEPIASAEVGEYKGKATLSLKRSEDDTYPFTFGKAKAQLIVKLYADIEKFAKE